MVATYYKGLLHYAGLGLSARFILVSPFSCFLRPTSCLTPTPLGTLGPGLPSQKHERYTASAQPTGGFEFSVRSENIEPDQPAVCLPMHTALVALPVPLFLQTQPLSASKIPSLDCLANRVFSKEFGTITVRCVCELTSGLALTLRGDSQCISQ